MKYKLKIANMILVTWAVRQKDLSFGKGLCVSQLRVI